MSSNSDDKILRSRKRYNLLPSANNSLILEIRQLLILAFYSILAVLARKGITLLTTFTGAYVGGIIWANFTSCFIMGMLVQSANMWDEFLVPNNGNFRSLSKKAEIQLYVGLTTGFCGSFSSFSSLILEMFLESANLDADSVQFPNAGGYGIMQFFSVLIAQISVSICAYKFGNNVIQFYDPVIPFIGLIEDVSVVLGLLSWIAVICLMAVKSWREWMFSCILSPIACWMRYYLAKNFNPKNPSFPIGTFMANVIATITISVFYLVNRGKTSDGRILNDFLSCQMVQGLEDGFSGTLSTVSTFIVEICNIKSVHSYIYGGISIVGCFCLMVIILGSYSWKQGLVDPIC